MGTDAALLSTVKTKLQAVSGLSSTVFGSRRALELHFQDNDTTGTDAAVVRLASGVADKNQPKLINGECWIDLYSTAVADTDGHTTPAALLAKKALAMPSLRYLGPNDGVIVWRALRTDLVREVSRPFGSGIRMRFATIWEDA